MPDSAESAATTDRRFAVPLYTVAEAARVVDVPVSTFTTWARGYERRSRGGVPVVGAPIVTTVSAALKEAVIPFVGLAEGYVLAAFRRAGVPLQRIRPALAALQEEFGVRHALASQRLYTDGAEVLVDCAERVGDVDAARELVVVRSGQRVFSEVVAGYLQRVEFSADGYARLIRLPQYARADVVVDAERSFGQPVFTHGGARVEDALAMFKAGEPLSVVSEEYGVPLDELQDAIRVALLHAA